MTEPVPDSSTTERLPSPRWRKSSFSGANGDCVELAAIGSGIAVRHSRSPDRGTLVYTRSELAAFVAGCKAGEFDDLL